MSSTQTTAEGVAQVASVEQVAQVQPSVVVVQAPAAGPQQISMNQTVNVGKNVNHCCWCVSSCCTGGLLIPCWIGACVGCCPKC